MRWRLDGAPGDVDIADHDDLAFGASNGRVEHCAI
jgi:hypothetical protein